MGFRIDDYIDNDVAYLIGLIVARGTIVNDVNTRRLVIEFPFSSLQAQGINLKFDQETAIKLGLFEIRERLAELLDTKISIIRKDSSIDFVIDFKSNSMIWRNIMLITEGKTSYHYFHVPGVFFYPDLPKDCKREFIKGYADVAGNVRQSNVYTDGRHRVRLDVLNNPSNWQVPIEICSLLQDQLDVPVQLITWGHPNLGRDFREHQINIFAVPFLKIGFYMDYKQKILEEFATYDEQHYPKGYNPCPGIKKIRKRKPHDEEEANAEKLDERLVNKHFDTYWQICNELGCVRSKRLLSSKIDDYEDEPDK